MDRGMGENAVRVRASYNDIQNDEWALLPATSTHAQVIIEEDRATIVNGKIKAEISKQGQISFYNQDGKLLLHETEDTYQLKYGGRELKPYPGSSDYSVKLRLESDPSEKLFGMGQYQHSFLNLKGCSLELTHRNSQISVPFVLSSAGYGFLWHNPAIGQVHFSLNVTN